MKLADYSAVVTYQELDAALAAGGFEGVFHYLGDDFALREEDPLLVAYIRARGWPQAGIFVPSLQAVNGAADAQRALFTYGFPQSSPHFLDIEPGEFAADPAGWANAADAWCDAMRAAGLSPGVYGTDLTVAACANHADLIWRAKPGQCDPAGPGLDPSFFAGRRASQCDQAVFAGVAMDVSYSEFQLGGKMLDPNDANDQVVIAAAHSWLNTGEPGSESLLDELSHTYYGTSPGFTSLLKAINGLQLSPTDVNQLRTDVADLKAAVGRIETALKGA